MDFSSYNQQEFPSLTHTLEKKVKLYEMQKLLLLKNEEEYSICV